MKTTRVIISAWLLTVVLTGCAGSGGGSEDAKDALCWLVFFPLCGLRDDGHASADSAQTFTSWNASQQRVLTLPGPEVGVTYESASDGSIRAVSAPAYVAGGQATITYDAQRHFGYFLHGDLYLNADQYGASRYPGQPGIEVAENNLNPDMEPTPFADLETGDVAVVANPYSLGWDYQSFGVWNAHANGLGNGAIGANSYGAATPDSSVPMNGTASFTGKLGGLYVSPNGLGSMAAAEVRVDANFASRTLSFASTGTTLARDPRTATPAPQFDLTGTMTYSPGRNAFSGTLANTGGTMSGTSKGEFYGPAAQELGGVFALRSQTGVETFTGAYGAKR